MTYWDGTHWVPEAPRSQPPSRSARGRRLLGATTEALLITALAFGLIAGTTVAGGGPGGGNGNGGGKPGATLAFEADAPVCVGMEYTVVGTGFKPDTWVTVGAHYADTTWWASGKTDAAGAIRLALTATSPGSVLHEAKQMTNSGRLRVVATTTLNVDP